MAYNSAFTGPQIDAAIAAVPDKADKKVPAAAGNIAALDATGNLADSGKKPTDFIATAARGAANGVAPLGADMKVPTANLPSIAPTFAYTCTGTNDDLAVQNIVNNFFTSGTAMSMKLIISGKMGLQSSPPDNRCIYLNATNERGAVCYLDFSNCDIPSFTYTYKTFLYIDSATVRLEVEGLVVQAGESGVYLNSASGNVFSNCTISMNLGRTSAYAVNLVSSSNNIFSNCKINNGITPGSGANCGALGLSASSNNVFSNCMINSSYDFAVYLAGSASDNTFSNCRISGNGSGVYFNSARGNTFSNCGISGNSYGMRVNSPSHDNRFSNCTISGGSGIFLAQPARLFFVNCWISGNTYGLHANLNYRELLTLINCKIIGATTGIQIETSNTTTEIKLISCSVKGTSAQDIQQTAATNTVKWYIEGCSFSRASIIADGTAAITQKTSASIYMPQYANQFSRTIE